MTATGLTRNRLNSAETQTTTNYIGSLCLPLPGLDYTRPLSKKAHFPLWIGMICLLRQEVLSPVPPSSLPRSLCGDCSRAGKLCMLELFFCEGEMLQLVWFAIMLSFVTILRWKEMSGIFLAKKKEKKNRSKKGFSGGCWHALHWREERHITHFSAPTPKANTIFISISGFYKSPSPFFWKFITKQL